MLRTTLLYVACLTLIFSCKKKGSQEPDNPTDPVITPTYANYMAMKPGNYWVYQRYTLDSANGAATAENQFDSCYVEKDTLIKGNAYHKYRTVSFDGTYYQEQFLRDSLSYTVTSAGLVVFSSDDFTHVFRTYPHTNPLAGIIDTIQITERMDYKDMQITVPAGQFKTSTFRRIYHMPLPTYNYGPYRSYDHSYAENVGLVKETVGWYVVMPTIYERRLVRYHVQ